jgi:hypothetical protein
VFFARLYYATKFRRRDRRDIMFGPISTEAVGGLPNTLETRRDAVSWPQQQTKLFPVSLLSYLSLQLVCISCAFRGFICITPALKSAICTLHNTSHVYVITDAAGRASEHYVQRPRSGTFGI